MEKANIPCAGHVAGASNNPKKLRASPKEWLSVMLKARCRAGGGKGMRLVHAPESNGFSPGSAQVKRSEPSQKHGVYIEKAIHVTHATSKCRCWTDKNEHGFKPCTWRVK